MEAEFQVFPSLLGGGGEDPCLAAMTARGGWGLPVTQAMMRDSEERKAVDLFLPKTRSDS